MQMVVKCCVVLVLTSLFGQVDARCRPTRGVKCVEVFVDAGPEGRSGQDTEVVGDITNRVRSEFNVFLMPTSFSGDLQILRVDDSKGDWLLGLFVWYDHYLNPMVGGLWNGDDGVQSLKPLLLTGRDWQEFGIALTQERNNTLTVSVLTQPSYFVGSSQELISHTLTKYDVDASGITIMARSDETESASGEAVFGVTCIDFPAAEKCNEDTVPK